MSYKVRTSTYVYRLFGLQGVFRCTNLPYRHAVVYVSGPEKHLGRRRTLNNNTAVAHVLVYVCGVVD